MPPQAESLEDAEKIESISNTTSSLMIISVVVPFAFMLFMSIGMSQTWQLYLMLQM